MRSVAICKGPLSLQMKGWYFEVEVSILERRNSGAKSMRTWVNILATFVHQKSLYMVVLEEKFCQGCNQNRISCQGLLRLVRKRFAEVSPVYILYNDNMIQYVIMLLFGIESLHRVISLQNVP